MAKGTTITLLVLIGSIVNVMPSTTRNPPVEIPPESPIEIPAQIGTVSPCAIATLFQCTKDLVGSAALLPWQQGAGPNVDPALACRLFAPALTCFKERSVGCSAQETLPIDTIISMYEYVCTEEGLKNYMSLRECFTSTDAIKAMSNCSDLSQVNVAEEICSVPTHFITCSSQVADQYCPQQKQALQSIVSSSFRTYETNFNCDLSAANLSDGNNGTPYSSSNWKLLFLIAPLRLLLH